MHIPMNMHINFPKSMHDPCPTDTARCRPIYCRACGYTKPRCIRLEVQRNLTVKALAAHNAEAYVGVGLVGSNDIAATRPADEGEVFVGFI